MAELEARKKWRKTEVKRRKGVVNGGGKRWNGMVIKGWKKMERDG